jgi:hypothetical protein
MQILEQNSKKVLDLNSHVNQLANALALELRAFAKENGWWRDVVYLYSLRTFPDYFERNYAFYNARATRRPLVAGFIVTWEKNREHSTLSFATKQYECRDIRVSVLTPRKLIDVIANAVSFATSKTPVVTVLLNGFQFSVVKRI